MLAVSAYIRIHLLCNIGLELFLDDGILVQGGMLYVASVLQTWPQMDLLELSKFKLKLPEHSTFGPSSLLTFT
jgi:hypothetical protein